MSNIQYAFIDRTQVPDRATLQASLDALGFDVRLFPDCTPFQDSGFLPLVLEGEEGPGFEMECHETADLLAQDERLRSIASDRTCCISMSWHGSMRDLACVMVVSYTLSKNFGAIVSYEGDPPTSEEELLAGVQEALDEARRERAQASQRPPDPGGRDANRPWWKLW